MNFSVRKATKEDAILIADLSHRTFYDTFSPYNSKENMDKFLSEQFTRGKLILEVSDPKNYFLLAYQGKDVIGYVKLRDDRQPAFLKFKKGIEIARLYAVKNSIGKGVGKLLMQSSIEIAKEIQKDVVWLGVWEKNSRAIDFYHRWGFKKFGEIDFLLGNDIQHDWLMYKSLVDTETVTEEV